MRRQSDLRYSDRAGVGEVKRDPGRVGAKVRQPDETG